jgi:hypothetical protein
VERRAIKEMTVGKWLSSVEMIEKVFIVAINIVVVSIAEAVVVEMFMVNVSMVVTRVEINTKQDGGIETLSVQKRSQVKKGLATHAQLLLRLVIEKFI